MTLTIFFAACKPSPVVLSRENRKMTTFFQNHAHQ